MLEILVVEDDPDLRTSLGEILREEGHAVSVAADGEAALACLATQSFHLIVSDVRLPKLDGLTLLHRVRRESPSTEVLLMTAYGSIGDAADALRDNAVHYLKKPFDLRELVGVVSRIDQLCHARQTV